MSESTSVWQLIKKNAAGKWVRVEPQVPGFPDCVSAVNGVTFLAELKYLDRWPPRSPTFLKIMPHQHGFLTTWPSKWILVARVDKEWLILDRLPEPWRRMYAEEWRTYGVSIAMGRGFWSKYDEAVWSMVRGPSMT